MEGGRSSRGHERQYLTMRRVPQHCRRGSLRGHPFGEDRMRPFTYTRVNSVKDAVSAIVDQREAKFLAGGTNLIDLMKMGVERPAHLIDISRLPLANIEEHEGGVRIGAMARNSDVANYPLIRQRFPVLSEALLAGASRQVRNIATRGGDPLQGAPCFHILPSTLPECNTAAPGLGCARLYRLS